MVSVVADMRFFELDDQGANVIPWIDASALDTFTLDHQALIEANTGTLDALLAGDPSVVSVTRIEWQNADAQVVIRGSGIGPLTDLSDLLQAIDDGVATGALSQIEISFGGTTALTLNLEETGVVLTSGEQEFALSGAFPTRLADFIGFAGAATELTSLYSEDAQTRAGAIAALDDYDLSGLTITDGGATVAAVTISETEYSVTVGNTSLTLLGQGLPAGDLGTVLDAGVQLLNDDIRDAGGQLDLDPLTALDIQSLDRLTLTVDDEDFLVVEGPITPGNIDADNVVTFDVIGSDDDDQLWLTPDNDKLDDADVSIQAGLGDDVVGIGIEIDEGELAFNNGNWTGRSASLQNYFSSMHVDGGDDWDYLFVGFSVSWWDDYIVDLNSDDKG